MPSEAYESSEYASSPAWYTSLPSIELFVDPFMRAMPSAFDPSTRLPRIVAFDAPSRRMPFDAAPSVVTLLTLSFAPVTSMAAASGCELRVLAELTVWMFDSDALLPSLMAASFGLVATKTVWLPAPVTFTPFSDNVPLWL
ncbi:MAG: hypothetical protein WDN30_04750 [Pararobbsia sp.]